MKRNKIFWEEREQKALKGKKCNGANGDLSIYFRKWEGSLTEAETPGTSVHRAQILHNTCRVRKPLLGPLAAFKRSP